MKTGEWLESRAAKNSALFPRPDRTGDDGVAG